MESNKRIKKEEIKEENALDESFIRDIDRMKLNDSKNLINIENKFTLLDSRSTELERLMSEKDLLLVKEDELKEDLKNVEIYLVRKKEELKKTREKINVIISEICLIASSNEIVKEINDNKIYNEGIGGIDSSRYIIRELNESQSEAPGVEIPFNDIEGKLRSSTVIWLDDEEKIHFIECCRVLKKSQSKLKKLFSKYKSEIELERCQNCLGLLREEDSKQYKVGESNWKSKGETMCSNWANKTFGRKYVKNNVRPLFLLNQSTGKCLELDIFIESKRIAIEYQGEQHSRAGIFGMNEKDFEYQQQKDEWKREWCREEKVKLLEIWHYDEFENIPELLDMLSSDNSGPTARKLLKDKSKKNSVMAEVLARGGDISKKMKEVKINEDEFDIPQSNTMFSSKSINAKKLKSEEDEVLANELAAKEIQKFQETPENEPGEEFARFIRYNIK